MRERASGQSPPGGSEAAAEADSGETSFGRGLHVLLALCGGVQRTPAEIAASVGLPLSTVYRYLRELRRLRLATEVSPGVYAAGVALFGLALGAPLIDQLRLHGQPMLRDLTTRTGETTMLSLRVDLGMMTVAQVESPQPMRLSFLPGTIHPLHAGATATVLLAYETPEIIQRVLERPLARFTPDTITDPQQLARRLAEIRAMGYAVSHGEADAHATAVAAPVLYNGRILCALTVAGPTTRFGSARVRDYAELLLGATRELSRQLGVSGT
jgi:DNA-binding IclR family transcriptional regulator